MRTGVVQVSLWTCFTVFVAVFQQGCCLSTPVALSVKMQPSLQRTLMIPKTRLRPPLNRRATRTLHDHDTERRNPKRILFLVRLVVVGSLYFSASAAPAVAAATCTSTYDVLETRKVSALVMACAAAGEWSESHTRIGSVVSGAMVSFFLGLALSNTGLLPNDGHVVYHTIQTYLLPFAVCQLMLGLEKNKIAKALRGSSKMLLAFVIASVGTIVGALLAFRLVPLAHASNFAAVFTATYIGGTLNFIATAEALRFQDPQLLAAVCSLPHHSKPPRPPNDPYQPSPNLSFSHATKQPEASPSHPEAFAADMVAMAMYFAILFFLGRRYEDKTNALEAAQSVETPDRSPRALQLEGLLSSAAIGSLLTWGGFLLAQRCGWAEGGVAVSCIFAVFASLAMPRSLSSSWSNAPELVGGFFLQLFFVSLGASTNLKALLTSNALLDLLAFIAVILLTQASFLWVFASRLLRIGLPDVLLASNAAVGGSATAGGMAGALDWRDKVTPAVMCGTLGYMIGTGAGLAVSWMTKM